MSNPDEITVMGPAQGSTPVNDMLLPPRLSATTDKFKWCKRVMLWVTTVKSFAKGGEKRAKGILGALGLSLFNALDPVFSSQVEQAIAAGVIVLEGEDNDDNQKKQQGVVNGIIELVARDSPADGIRRLVQMMRQVLSCTRKPGESPAFFARRFQALALDYLNHCDTATIQQDSQNFAMLLLENANIPASVYSSIITRLVSMISSRSDGSCNKIFVISNERLERIRAKVLAIQKLVEENPSPPLSEHENGTKEIVAAITATIDANELHITQDRTTFRITLDDAVEVLKDLKVEDEGTACEDNKNKRVSSLLGKRDHYDDDQNRYRNNRDKRQKTYIPTGQGPKATSRCRSCKELNHWYRDPECIYNVIKALMEGKEIATEVIQKLSPSVRDLFKDENGRYKNKVPVSATIGVIGDSDNSNAKEDSNAKTSNSYFR